MTAPALTNPASPLAVVLIDPATGSPYVGGVTSPLTVVASSGANQTVDVSSVGTADITLTANMTLALSGATTGYAYRIRLILRQGLGGGFTVTWPAHTHWTNNNTAPTLTLIPTYYDVIELSTVDGGATWQGTALALGVPNSDVIAYDTFTRADSAATMGSTEFGSKTWTPAAGTWGISSNRAYKAVTDTDCTTFIDAGVADIDITCIVQAAVGGNPGICFRGLDNSNFLMVACAAGAFGVFQLNQKAGGSYTQLGSNGPAATAGVDYVVRIVAVGTTVTVYINGAQSAAMSGTFGGINTSRTKVGMRHGDAAAIANRWDNLVVSPP